MVATSVLELFLAHEPRGQETAALVKTDGVYKPHTWAEMINGARTVAKGLIALGVQPGDRVCLIGSTRLEWVSSDMGVLWSGAVTVPIYQSNLPDECAYVANHAGAVIVLAEDATQTAKFLEMRAQLPSVKHIVQLEGDVTAEAAAGGFTLPLADVIARGASTSDELLQQRRESLTPDSICTMIYTSGTTGQPKGVVLPHSALLYEATASAEMNLIHQDDVQLLFLPLAHVFAKVLEVIWLQSGHVMAFAENMQTIKQNLGEVHPTLMAGVPRVFEKFYSAVVDKGLSAPGLKGTLFKAALEISRKRGEAEFEGRSLGFVDNLKLAVLSKLVFTKLSVALGEVLGGRMRIMISGGAPLPKTVAWFFRDAGFEICEGYGLTETSAATCINLPGSVRLGTVGRAAPGTDIRIADDGEILIKGPGVMREYWNNPEATAEAIVDGWFHSGDIGELDRDGYVRITDRKKDLIVTAGGKNVAPQKIESLLKSQQLVSQAVVHGDRRKYLTALLTVDPEVVKAHGSGSYEQLSQLPAVREAMQATVDEVNAELASYERIKKFAILPADFSQETGELTPKLSVRRKVVGTKYKDIIDSMYDEQVML